MDAKPSDAQIQRWIAEWDEHVAACKGIGGLGLHNLVPLAPFVADRAWAEAVSQAQDQIDTELEISMTLLP